MICKKKFNGTSTNISPMDQSSLCTLKDHHWNCCLWCPKCQILGHSSLRSSDHLRELQTAPKSGVWDTVLLDEISNWQWCYSTVISLKQQYILIKEKIHCNTTETLLQHNWNTTATDYDWCCSGVSVVFHWCFSGAGSLEQHCNSIVAWKVTAK